MYLVEFHLCDSKKAKGYRSSIYKCAQNSLACYCVDGKDKSIFYDATSATPNDLRVSLLFKQEENALHFQNSLSDIAERFSHFKDKFVLDTRDPVVVQVDCGTNKLQRVLASDYQQNDNDESPIISLNDMMSTETTVTIYSNTEILLKTFEKEDVVAAFTTKWYRCHMIPDKSKLFQDDPLRNNEDNFIYASWNVHQLFDGLNTTSRGVGVVLRFVSASPEGEEVLVTPYRYERRFRVEISLQFKDARVASTFGPYWKDGTERVDDLTYKSFLYVKNVENVKECLIKKFRVEKEEREDPWLEEMEY